MSGQNGLGHGSECVEFFMDDDHLEGGRVHVWGKNPTQGVIDVAPG